MVIVKRAAGASMKLESLLLSAADRNHAECGKQGGP